MRFESESDKAKKKATKEIKLNWIIMKIEVIKLITESSQMCQFHHFLFLLLHFAVED